MKIIQTYSSFDEGSPYLNNVNDKERMLLQFYTFLLSYATLKKYYKRVSMFCNERAYKTLIKYIPYDEIILIENKNSFKFWSYYKVDIIKLIEEDFVHVDCDVFLFDDLFSKFISNNEYDIIVQDVLSPQHNISRTYVDDFSDYLNQHNIFNVNMYDGKCFSCGTIGMRIKFKDSYVQMCDLIKKGFEYHPDREVKYMGMICEELALYLYAQKHGLKFYDILPYEDTLQYGTCETGNKMKYTHMWFHTKFEVEYAKLIRNKLLTSFPEYKAYINLYEEEIIKNTDMFNKNIFKF